MCFKCRGPWHSESSCEASNNPEYLLALKNPMLKQCPACFKFIEKFGGCLHMKCTECNHEFCWNCLEVYLSSHICLVQNQGQNHVPDHARNRWPDRVRNHWADRVSNCMRNLLLRIKDKTSKMNFFICFFLIIFIPLISLICYVIMSSK